MSLSINPPTLSPPHSKSKHRSTWRRRGRGPQKYKRPIHNCLYRKSEQSQTKLAVLTVGIGCFSSLPGSILKWLCRKTGPIEIDNSRAGKEGWGGVEGKRNEAYTAVLVESLCNIYPTAEPIEARTLHQEQQQNRPGAERRSTALLLPAPATNLTLYCQGIPKPVRMITPLPPSLPTTLNDTPSLYNTELLIHRTESKLLCVGREVHRVLL